MEHNLEPIFNKQSKILILGSFPSVISRREEFYYANPQNRFWPLLELLFNEQIIDKKQFLLKHNIALFDVVKQCDLRGSDDSSITNVIPNDLGIILNSAKIEQIFCNGNKAYELYMEYIYPINNIMPIKLPSTSSANAKYTIPKLLEAYNQILFYQPIYNRVVRKLNIYGLI